MKRRISSLAIMLFFAAETNAATNIALDKTALASSVETSSLLAVNALDGNDSSRWASAYSDSEWLQIDLGARYDIDNVVIEWEIAYGDAYIIQTSDDASTWTDVYTESSGDGGTDDLAVSGAGRYVRMYGVSRATGWGYSIYEMNIYGTLSSEITPTENIALNKTVSTSTDYSASLAGEFVVDGNSSSRWSSDYSDNEWLSIDLGATYEISNVVIAWETAYADSYKIQTSIDESTWTDVYTETASDGGTDDLSVSGAGRYVRMQATSRATPWGYSIYEMEVYGSLFEDDVIAAGDLALNKTISVSSTYNAQYTGEDANDGDPGSRWSSEYSDDQWLIVDLGASYEIGSIFINWEVAHAKEYKLQGSNNQSTWTDLHHETASQGGTENIEITPPGNYRYVRMLGIEAATEWGYSIWSFAVYAVGDGPVTPLLSLIPYPESLVLNEGSFTLDSNTEILVEEGSAEARFAGEYFSDVISASTGFNLYVADTISTPTANSIYFDLDSSQSELGDEGYTLVVTSDLVTVTAYQPAGFFNGMQTLRQLLPADIEKQTQVYRAWTMPNVAITDVPRFAWRGYMLDVSRHFFTIAELKRQIDLMAIYKINRFHIHLSDDQGWRIEIKSWPNLAIYGGSTEVGGGPGGYYTQQEYIDLVAYAKARNVMIIPEIDVPGHINAELASYPELNADGVAPALYTGTEVGISSLDVENPITLEFMDDVIREIAAITDGPYIHMGGDEAHQTSHENYLVFIDDVGKIINKYGKTVIGWAEIFEQQGLATESLGQFWYFDLDKPKANGSQTIMSPATKAYMDMRYYSDYPIGLGWAGNINTQTAYNWDPASYNANIDEADVIGVEAPLWSETVENQTHIDSLTYPRLPGIAEIGWSPLAGRYWDEYKGRLSDHGVRLKNLGVEFFEDPIVEWK